MLVAADDRDRFGVDLVGAQKGMTALEGIIHNQITRFGPISVADYMTLCLLHPQHGYYITGDPFGAAGDFITAPEISQMFGEMLGLVLVQCWQDQGCPTSFILAELGPGRGTLMADVLRVGAKVPGFVAAAEIWLVEASPALQAIQQNMLAGFQVNWVRQMTELPDRPLFLLANEFFDALPVRQFVRAETGWQEQMVGLSDGRLAFGLAAAMTVEALEDQAATARIGHVVETNAAAQGIVRDVARRIAAHGGMGLIVDYGSWGSDGDTLQALRRHQKQSPLAYPGEADLTAHVDFAALARAAKGVAVTGLTPQGVLLERLGITARAQALAGSLSGAALENHIAAHHRLTHPNEMGSLFQALALYPADSPAPPGFD
jgi:NADH dehydrogenase [ubiquinone] 1 alpha subcomplex assembly factor 7